MMDDAMGDGASEKMITRRKTVDHLIDERYSCRRLLQISQV
jgi:hypothetical protein